MIVKTILVSMAVTSLTACMGKQKVAMKEFITRDGAVLSFYWHKEYTGHYSYHLPGFAVNDNNEERAVVSLVRDAQAQIAGEQKTLPLLPPEPPRLHPIVNR